MERELVDFKKITIECEGVRTRDAIAYVGAVMSKGTISRTRGIKHYCHLSVFGGGITVICSLTRANNIIFSVQKEK